MNLGMYFKRTLCDLKYSFDTNLKPLKIPVIVLIFKSHINELYIQAIW